MTTTDTTKICELNDRFRAADATTDPAGLSLGKKVLTSGVRALGLEHVVAIAEQVRAYDGFMPANDPYGEHDMGFIDYNGERIMWTIAYYDRASFGIGHDYGSENPADPAVTLRVLTVMLASEY